MAKKYNKGRQQKKNINKAGMEKYRVEIARELGVELPANKKKPGSGPARESKPAFTFDDNAPLM